MVTWIWELLLILGNVSGVTRNSGWGAWTNIQVESSLLFPYPLSPLRFLPLPFASYPFMSFPSLPSLLFPTLSFLFPSPYNSYRMWGSAIAHQQVRAEPCCQMHFCAIHSPKSANLLKFHSRVQDINSCDWIVITSTLCAGDNASSVFGRSMHLLPRLPTWLCR